MLFIRKPWVFSFLLATACADPSSVFLVAPTVELGVESGAPLSGRLTLTAERPVRVLARTTVDGETWEHQYQGLQATWEVPLLRFLPDAQHTIVIEVTDEEGSVTTAAPIVVTTPALPSSFPHFTLVQRDEARQEPGFTLFAVPPVANGQPSHAVVLDDRGRVVWYYETAMRLADAVPYVDGTVSLTNGRTRVLDIDMLGRVQRSMRSRLDTTERAGDILVDTDTIHHELERTGADTYRTLSTELRPLDGYPTSPTDLTPSTEPSNVIGDVVVEFDASGNVTRTLNLFDFLDVHRLGWDSFGAFWDVTYPTRTPTIDWAHANAVVVDPEDGNYVISMRHQDAVIEVTPTGEVRWILGDPTGWVGALGDAVLSPIGDGFAFPYAMHAPERTDDGTWLLFDNGVGRAIPPVAQLETTLRSSRAVEYEIDETAGTVREVWEYGAERGFDLYSSIVGDADPLPMTGNVLVTFGGILPSDEGAPAAHLIEVTHTTPAEVVFEVTLDDDNPDGAASRIIYRAEHLASLYPSGT